MKHINMYIKCCNECPFLKMDDYARPGYIWWCECKGAPQGDRGHVLDMHERGKDIPVWCPLPDAHALELPMLAACIKPVENKCPKCRTVGEVGMIKCDNNGVHQNYQCPKCGCGWSDRI